jgi:type I restriction enzyme M protein
MNEAEYASLFKEIKLPADVASRLAATCGRPEGDVEVRWVHKLVTHYMYSPHQLACGVSAGAGRNAATSAVTADIVVYRDQHRKEPFIVVEVKKPGENEKKGIKQAESYARNLGAEYHVWSDWNVTHFFKTAKYIEQSTPVGNIPSWSEGRENKNYLSKDHVLPPFRDEEHLREVVRQSHNKIFFNLGHDPAKSFDELMKLLFLKIYDERQTPKRYEFAILPGQSKEEVATHIRQLFKKASESRRYSDVFTTRFSKPGQNINLDLDDDTIFFLVKQFQSYSLINTTSTLEGVDIKGTVFERMVGSTFRGELGAYFTPRELVEFCVRLVDPDIEDTVLDPACGSGGFLIMVIKHIIKKIQKDNPNLSEGEIYASVKDFADSNLFGVDINERMVRVCKMNLIMHGDGYSGIYNTHGLGIGSSDRLPIREGSISKIFSNPPFAGREEDPAYLARFEAAKSDDGSLVSLHKTIPFVEMIVRLLAPDGVAALVLPNGIFNSQSRTFKKVREIIFRQTRVMAVIGLPHWVFFHTGCDVQGSLLFIQKEKPPEDYQVFMDVAENVGFDVKGDKVDKNDLPEILKRYYDRPPRHLIPFSLLNLNDRFDPLFYIGSKGTEFSMPSGLSFACATLWSLRAHRFQSPRRTLPCIATWKSTA